MALSSGLRTLPHSITKPARWKGYPRVVTPGLCTIERSPGKHWRTKEEEGTERGASREVHQGRRIITSNERVTGKGKNEYGRKGSLGHSGIS